MQIAPKLRGSVWGKWLSEAPPAVVDSEGDAFLESARKWLLTIPIEHTSNFIAISDQSWKSAKLTGLPKISSRSLEIKISLIQYRMALNKCIEDEINLGTDRLQQAIATMIVATAGASIAAALGLTAVIAGAAFAGIGGSFIGIGYAMASVRRNSVKKRRNRMINEIYDALTNVIERLDDQ